MKTPYELIKSASTALYKHFGHEPAEMLIWTSTIGWLLSGLAQMGAVQINKDIPKDQKKFLLPQEFSDMAINVITFFTFTSVCERLTNKLINSGKLLSKPVRDFVGNKVPKENIGKYSTDMTEILKALPDSAEILDKHLKFRAGVKVGVNLVACVIAGNLLTPVLRNYIGAKVQKHLIKNDKDKAQVADIKRNPTTPISPVLPYQNYTAANSQKFFRMGM
jgi:hypothetical protein